MRSLSTWSPLLLFSTLACGSSAPAAQSPAAAPPSEASSAEAPVVAAGPMVWREDMSDREKGAFMKAVVMPRMSKLFKEFDAKEFEKFSCKTCHGPDFKDPDDFLPTLEVKGGKLTAMDTKPAIATFMHDKVTPEMANIFGEPVYDPATQKGFGCKGCHSIKMD